MGIAQILEANAHRPWDMPRLSWRYYQEWNNAIFLHWKVPVALLHPLIPSAIELDTFDREAWISLVAFTMEKLRINSLPSVPIISNFHEINLRTYVIRDHKPGVYFLTMEAQKQIAVFVAKNISGLPYEKATLKRTSNGQSNAYYSSNPGKGFMLESIYEVDAQHSERTLLDKWLVERYCLYFGRDNKLFRYDIHHAEWDIKRIRFQHLKLQYKAGDITLTEKQPDLFHYSSGMKVLAWPRKLVADGAF